MGTILKVDNINVYYGAIHAIKGISFEVNEGEIVTLIGANGAGKSTTLRPSPGFCAPVPAASSSTARTSAMSRHTSSRTRDLRRFLRGGASSSR